MQNTKRVLLAAGLASALTLGCSGEGPASEAQSHQMTTTVHEGEQPTVTGKKLDFDSSGQVLNSDTGTGGSGSEACEDGTSAACVEPQAGGIEGPGGPQPGQNP